MKREELEKIRSRCYEVTDEHTKAIDDLIEFCIRYGFEKGREGIDSVTDPKYVNSEEVIKELDKEQDDKR